MPLAEPSEREVSQVIMELNELAKEMQAANALGE